MENNRRIEAAMNVCQTTIARDAWERGQPLAVHGWIYEYRTDCCATSV